MAELITYEQRTIRLAVTVRPDTASWDGRVRLVPHTVEITYTRDTALADPVDTRVTMTGRRRLKNGSIGRTTQTERFWGPGRDRPDWIDDLVERHRPTDWQCAAKPA